MATVGVKGLRLATNNVVGYTKILYSEKDSRQNFIPVKALKTRFILQIRLREFLHALLCLLAPRRFQLYKRPTDRGVSSFSSLGWPAGWPHLYLGGGRIPDDIMHD